MGQRLLVLVLLGVMMTLALVGSALFSVSRVSAVNRELVQVTGALRHHKTADEMHDALRADVARAELVSMGRSLVSAASVRRDTSRHAHRFRAALEAAGALELPAPLTRAFSRLRSVQEVYIKTAEAMVASALSPRGIAPGAQSDYEAAFLFLVPDQNRLTRRLVATTERVERAAAVQRSEAERTIFLAAAAALAGWVGLAVWHHRSMRGLQRALVREAEQRSAADVLQRSLLPLRLPRVPGARLFARSMAGGSRHRVGGDWYDAIRLPTGEVLLVVGDVVGHDLPAAGVMGQLRNSLRAYALEDSSPSSVLARVNRAAHLLGTSDFATCIVAVLDPTTMVVRWSSAGHPPPLVADPEGERRLLTGEPGPPLGVVEGAVYPEHEVMGLAHGATLLLYSDGLVERPGVSIDAGLVALETVPLSQTEPQAMCAELFEVMLAGASSHDDVTCLVLRIEAEVPHATGRSASPAPTPSTVT